MPRYVNTAGRTVSAMAGGFLERRLLRDGWKPVSEEPVSGPNLNGKTRADLNEIAAGLGIEAPESLPNIAAVKAAIEAA